MAQPADTSQFEQERVMRGGALRYLAVWGALVLLTLATVSAAGLPLSEPWHLAAALAIAVVKGTLVALFFMHLAQHAGANRLVFVTALVFVALLIGLIVADNATRFPLANPPHAGTQQYLPPNGIDAPR
jgi:cytochrome c oxidase subunit IV